MNVAQLIEILQKMPQDAPVLSACSNHYARRDDSFAIGYAIERNSFDQARAVVVGDWTWINRVPEGSNVVRGPFDLVDGTYFEERDGKVRKMRIKLVPEQRIQTFRTIEARLTSEPMEEP